MTSNCSVTAEKFIQFFVNNQPDAQFLLPVYIYSNSLHVSSTPVLIIRRINCINTLNSELNPICHLLALLRAHHILHVSRIRVNTTPGTCQLWYMIYLLTAINPLNSELNPICHLPALLGAHHILHVSRIRVNTSGICQLWYDMIWYIC